jgi:hypothetical protein
VNKAIPARYENPRFVLDSWLTEIRRDAEVQLLHSVGALRGEIGGHADE